MSEKAGVSDRWKKHYRTRLEAMGKRPQMHCFTTDAFLSEVVMILEIAFAVPVVDIRGILSPPSGDSKKDCEQLLERITFDRGADIIKRALGLIDKHNK